jgi:uncharacterized protein with HEPN domain
MRRTRERLLDALDAIAKIQSRLPKTKDDLVADEMLQVWMVHHLMIVGEALRHIDPAFKQKFPSIPWREIAGARDIIVHDYFRIDYDIVWTMVSTDVPELKVNLSQLLPLLPQ